MVLQKENGEEWTLEELRDMVRLKMDTLSQIQAQYREATRQVSDPYAKMVGNFAASITNSVKQLYTFDLEFFGQFGRMQSEIETLKKEVEALKQSS